MQPRPPVDPALQRLRERLDRVNREIRALVQELGALVLEVAELKDELGLDSYDPRREAEMVREMSAASTGPFGAEELAEVFRTLFAVSLSLERRSRHPHPTERTEPVEPKVEEPRLEDPKLEEPDSRLHPKIQAIRRR
jgi:chorismate mutase